MGIGAQAIAPHGFVEFCGRSSADCGASPEELKAMEIASSTVVAQPVSAIAYDWSGAFRAAAQAPAPPPVQQISVTYDWASAFAKAKAEQPQLQRAVYDAPVPARREPVPTLNEATWKLLTSTNERINRAIAERSDQEIYGVSEFWATPLEAGLSTGDCEDYVLEKRRALIAAGLPASALSIAVVTTPRGDTHAVLLAATDRGEYVLDNLSAWVLPWTKTPYQWHERQVAGSASHWAFASGFAQPPAPAGRATSPEAGLLLASLR